MSISADRKKELLEQAKELAAKQNYTLVTTEWVSHPNKLELICPDHGTFYISWGNFKWGKGCGKCKGKKITVAKLKPSIFTKLQTAATEAGYELLSTEYTKCFDHYLFKCPTHGEFTCTGNNFQRGKRCPKCAPNATLTTEEFKQRVEKAGYLMTEAEYVPGSHRVHKLLCPYHGEFETTLASITKMGGCPDCSRGVSERHCQEILTDLLGKSFKKVRMIPWPGGPGLLELDLYNEDLKLALEYQGIQHYKYFPLFHKTEEEFALVQERDAFKKQWCLDNSITLFEVPYNIKFNDRREYISALLNKMGLLE